MFNYATFSLIMILIKNRIPYLNSIKIPYNLGKEEKYFHPFRKRHRFASLNLHLAPDRLTWQGMQPLDMVIIRSII